jgi:Mg-chelatase subunit ChlD
MNVPVRPAVGLLLALALVPLASAGALRADPKPAAKPLIEVVFTLDTTGSMGGLIEGAKRKIWSVANQVVSGKPTPDVKVGLVAYRDRGDAYITRITPLTADLDAVYAELTQLRADGGGDGPESVNQALNEAVTKINWSKDKETLKIIYLVGDAPPHMDYPDDVKYPETCKLAVQNNILINTIQCGGDAAAAEIWKKIALSAEGQFAAIPQDGGVAAITTPFDLELSKANGELATKTYLYGKRDKQVADARKLEINAGGLGGGGFGGFGGAGPAGPRGGAAPGAPAAEVAASRASVIAKSGRVADYDLLDALKENRVQLKDLKDEELPKELQKLTPKQREAKLNALRAEREKQLKHVAELSRKRDAYITEEQKKNKGGKDSFDQQVLDQLRSQAAKHGIKY